MRRAVRAMRQAISPRLAISRDRNIAYIRNTPKRVFCTGAFKAADKDNPTTRRVSAGSMMPSSHSRAVAY
jgi:hypothetical protein